jgi:hypothetical protein
MKEGSQSNRANNVLRLQVARKRARQSRGGSNASVGPSANQRPLERLEAENAQLRRSVVDLMLELQASRDSLGHPPSEIRPNRRHRPPGQ